LQARLVGLDGEQVAPAPADDPLGQGALAGGGVAGDGAPPDGQDAEQLEGGLVLAGLGIGGETLRVKARNATYPNAAPGPVRDPARRPET
jgi:hypothetical protein